LDFSTHVLACAPSFIDAYSKGFDDLGRHLYFVGGILGALTPTVLSNLKAMSFSLVAVPWSWHVLF
jgi:hypothetical protein